MATVARSDRRHPDVTVLRGVSFKEYSRLTRLAANRFLRMAYWDGTLEIMSPILLEHERFSDRLRLLITTVADVLHLVYEGSGSFTLRRKGEGPRKGTGREADQSFYIQNVARLPMDREVDLVAGDPPPDLWVEVDHRASSRARLPTYARLGVPEVWQYRAETRKIRFLRLDGGASIQIDLSLALPVLTPALVQDALNQGRDMVESEWVKWLRVWARRFGDQPV